MTRTAACSCRTLSVAVGGEPTYVIVCNCLDCQKRTGSAFGVSTYWPKSAITKIFGESTVWRRLGWEGRWLDYHFCPACGSTVFWYVEWDTDQIGIALGNFADPNFNAPDSAYWCENKHPWVNFPDEWPQFTQQT